MNDTPITFSHPENQKNDIGHFMMAAGAVIKHPTEEKILVLKRVDNFNNNEWEQVYGRIAQHEEITDGLKREVKEETGLDVTIVNPLRFWHMYRGTKHHETELFGMTFICKASTDKPTIDLKEHSEYRWVSPEEALSLIRIEGVKKDIELFMNKPQSLAVYSLENKPLL